MKSSHKTRSFQDYEKAWRESGLLPPPYFPNKYLVQVRLKNLDACFTLAIPADDEQDAVRRAPFMAVTRESPCSIHDLHCQVVGKDESKLEPLTQAELNRREFLYHIGAVSALFVASSSFLRFAQAGTTTTALAGTVTGVCNGLGAVGTAYCGGVITNASKGVIYSSTATNTPLVNTFTIPCGVTSITVTAVGGGGGGGDNNTNATAGNNTFGGGGAAGTTGTITVTPLSNVTVTVASKTGGMANGGTSSFGSSFTATGGKCGSNDPGVQGAGGTYTGGTGANGGNGGSLTGSIAATTGYAGGGGGGSGWSSQGVGQSAAAGTGTYGGGGGGAGPQAFQGTGGPGGSGGNGGSSGFAGGIYYASGGGPVGGLAGVSGGSGSSYYAGAGGGGSYGGGGGCAGGWTNGAGSTTAPGGGGGGLVLITWT